MTQRRSRRWWLLGAEAFSLLAFAVQLGLVRW
jgi:hypothetical protein